LLRQSSRTSLGVGHEWGPITRKRPVHRALVVIRCFARYYILSVRCGTRISPRSKVKTPGNPDLGHWTSDLGLAGSVRRAFSILPQLDFCRARVSASRRNKSRDSCPPGNESPPLASPSPSPLGEGPGEGLSLVPKVSLGTHLSEAPLRSNRAPHRTAQRHGKRSFQKVRAQAELGHEG